MTVYGQNIHTSTIYIIITYIHGGKKMKYDIIHFEALGKEADHLREETEKAQAEGKLPKEYNYVITPLNLQQYMAENPDTVLPDIITTKTHSKLPEEYLNNGVKKSIITRSAGYDHFEHLAEVANVTSLREYCVNAVAQTGIKFAYAAAGYLNHYTNNTLTFERNKTYSFMEFNKDRIATVFGVGKIGKRVYELLEGNGLTVQAVDIRQDELNTLYGGTVNFVTKEEAIANSDIIINAMNLTRLPESKFYNVNYFSEEDLAKAKDGLVFVNVTRGEIAPESTLLKFYKEGKIIGIGLDVFSDENGFSAAVNGKKDFETDNHKAGKELLDMAINRTGNVYVQPHQAFNSDVAAMSKASETIKHMIAWHANNKVRFDEQLPYYVG